MIDPITTPSAFDYIELAGQFSPGVCVIKGANRAYKWDAPTAKGSSGADPTFQGRDPKPFTITFQLWHPSHFHTWELFHPLLLVPDGEQPTAMDIVHPWCQLAGIDSVVVEEIGQFENDGKGLYSIDVTFRPFKRPTPAGSGTSKGGTVGGTKPAGDNPFANAIDPGSLGRAVNEAFDPLGENEANRAFYDPEVKHENTTAAGEAVADEAAAYEGMQP